MEKKNNYDSYSGGYSGKYSFATFSGNGWTAQHPQLGILSQQFASLYNTAVKAAMAQEPAETTASAESSDLPSILHACSLCSTRFVGTVQPFD